MLDAVPGVGARRGDAGRPGARRRHAPAYLAHAARPRPADRGRRPGSRCACRTRCSRGSSARTASTTFGRQHGFAAARELRGAIRAAVPVGVRSLAPVRRRARSSAARRALTRERSLQYVRTSGIDRPAQGHSAHRARTWTRCAPSSDRSVAFQYRACPEAFSRQHPGDRQPGRGRLARRTASRTGPPPASSPPARRGW